MSGPGGRGRFFLTAPVLTVTFCLGPLLGRDANRADYSSARLTGVIRDSRVKEVSGIVRAPGKPGYFWVHNDSGGKARLFLVHVQGRVVCELTVTGAGADDWEDIAVGPGPLPGRHYLYVADTGNNSGTRKILSIERILHPKLNGKSPPPKLRSERATHIRFRYPDGVFDCEAMVVHPKSGDLFLFTKNALTTGVYRLRAPHAPRSILTAEKVTVMRPGFFVTGADLSPQGDRLLLRTYLSVLEYRAPAGQPFESIFLQPRRKLPVARRERQSEAIGYVHGGAGYITSDEGSPAPLHVFLREPAPPGPQPRHEPPAE